jgi:hypothetical protein
LEDKLFTILQLSLFEAFYITGFLILIGILLGIIENRANLHSRRILGKKGILATACIGAPIHELGHLLMCYLFKLSNPFSRSAGTLCINQNLNFYLFAFSMISIVFL